MNRSESINEIAAALSKAQSQIQLAHRDTKNAFFNSSYADLASVWDACREPLTSNGLCVVQFPSADGPIVTVETLLLHSSGQWFSSSLTVASKKDDAQGIGSCVTYLRRYSLQSMVGVAPDDDDGNASVGQLPKVEAARRKKEAAVQHQHSLEDAKYIADAKSGIIDCTSLDELVAIGELLREKPEPIRAALRDLYRSRLAVLESQQNAESQHETATAQ